MSDELETQSVGEFTVEGILDEVVVPCGGSGREAWRWEIVISAPSWDGICSSSGATRRGQWLIKGAGYNQCVKEGDAGQSHMFMSCAN